MNKLFVLAALSSLLALSACQQRDRDRAQDTPATGSTMPPIDAPSPSTTMPGRGEGEKEAAATGQEIIAAFNQDIANDAALAAAMGAVELVARTDGTLVLQGTVATAAQKDSLAAYAAKHAGVMKVDNQIKIEPNAGKKMNDDADQAEDDAKTERDILKY